MGVVTPGGPNRPAADFPDIGWQRQTRGCLPALVNVVVGVLAAGALLYAILIGFARGHLITGLGALGLAATLGLTVLLRSEKHGESGAIRPRIDPEYGAGVVFSARRGFAVLALCLAGTAVFFSAAWLDSLLGVHDDGLLPASKDNSGGATLAAVLAVLMLGCIVVLGSFYIRQTVELYPTGIRRIMVRPFLRRHDEHFLAWDDISSIDLTVIEQPTYGGTSQQRLIQIGTGTPRLVQYPKFDRPDSVALIGSLLGCPAEQMLATLQYLKAHLEHRALLARQDATTWFTRPGVEPTS
ncbi:hypothetical protein [Nocardia seriolae]|uniref:PH domain-containing protein n=1 Tax=Nocardia seriolae TaxID=37332 RepID=A0ABC8ASZ4_9NOCA|nr:hypothetical protein [Nocardia seriolae]APA97250.1 hypothetical protein NS506_03197 [Nocardia seriolae]OJF81726.1 hypothetical protein NS14008_24330 [Nocardia seriolae]QOW31078.1 hypothetical protein IMZ23_23480 [Nocardia seriolae]QUN18294.1 hypothetical protein KEC46_02195 [Nocardia seriolae]WKY50590.1 hypothetical protein Q5P07_26755 [Nocardia seriolae]